MEPSERLDRSTLALVVVAGVFDIVAFAVYAVGLEVAPTWLVGLASSFGPVIAVAYGVWRLGERPRATQWLGLALLGVGVVVLALAGEAGPAEIPSCRNRTSVLVFDVRWRPHPTSPRPSRRSRLAGVPQLRGGEASWA